MIDLPLPIIPTWVIFLLSVATVLHRFYVSVKYPIAVISRWENFMYGIALVMLLVFYGGLLFGDFTLQTNIALSRLTITWLLLVSLYISYNMAKRNK